MLATYIVSNINERKAKLLPSTFKYWSKTLVVCCMSASNIHSHHQLLGIILWPRPMRNLFPTKCPPRTEELWPCSKGLSSGRSICLTSSCSSPNIISLSLSCVYSQRRTPQYAGGGIEWTMFHLPQLDDFNTFQSHQQLSWQISPVTATAPATPKNLCKAVSNSNQVEWASSRRSSVSSSNRFA